MDARPHILVAGAGSVGCYIGGLLALAGRRVSLLTRPRVAAELREHGLHLSSLEGWAASPSVEVGTDPDVLASANLILVTVKSSGTEEIGRLIAAHAPPSATVISLQNGVAGAARLRTILPGRKVLAGTVTFNVLHRGAGRFHRGTSGPLIVERGDADAFRRLGVPQLEVEEAADMEAVQWGKLLLNLNNALNALSGLPLRDQLLDRRWRRLLAAQQEEALTLLAAAGIKPWSMGPIPPRLLPHILRLPTPLFRLLARSAVRIDPLARSSMWEDLERGRRTEVDELQGAVVDFAHRLGRAAPVNRLVLEQVRRAEHAGRGSPQLSPELLSRPAR